MKRALQTVAMAVAILAAGIGHADAAGRVHHPTNHSLRWRIHQLENQMAQQIAYDTENETRALSEQAIMHNCWFGLHASLDPAGVFHLDPAGTYLIVTMSSRCLDVNGGVKSPNALRGAAGRLVTPRVPQPRYKGG